MTNFVRDAFILGYAAAVGFVAAGIIASLYRLLTSEPARFALLGRSMFAMATSFFFCALTGPVIIVEHAVQNRRSQTGTAGRLFAGLFVAAMWSCCSGVVVLSLVLSVMHSIA